MGTAHRNSKHISFGSVFQNIVIIATTKNELLLVDVSGNKTAIQNPKRKDFLAMLKKKKKVVLNTKLNLKCIGTKNKINVFDNEKYTQSVSVPYKSQPNYFVKYMSTETCCAVGVHK